MPSEVTVSVDFQYWRRLCDMEREVLANSVWRIWCSGYWRGYQVSWLECDKLLHVECALRGEEGGGRGGNLSCVLNFLCLAHFHLTRVRCFWDWETVASLSQTRVFLLKSELGCKNCAVLIAAYCKVFALIIANNSVFVLMVTKCSISTLIIVECTVSILIFQIIVFSYWLFQCIVFSFWLLLCVVFSFWLLQSVVFSDWLFQCVAFSDWVLPTVVLHKRLLQSVVFLDWLCQV